MGLNNSYVPQIVHESDDVIRVHNRRINQKRSSTTSSASSEQMSQNSLYSILRAWVGDNPHIPLAPPALLSSAEPYNKHDVNNSMATAATISASSLAEIDACQSVVTHLMTSLRTRHPLPPMDAMAHLNSLISVPTTELLQMHVLHAKNIQKVLVVDIVQSLTLF